MKFFYYFLLGVCFLSNQRLLSVLDGRVTPIILNTTYTFTNYEWVKGRVTFNQGFDLPLNGTVLFDSIETTAGTITFSNSTLVLKNNLLLGKNALFVGIGFIDPRGSIIKLRSDMVLALTGKTTLFILSNGEIRGEQSNSLRTSNALFIFSDQVYSFTFSNISLRDPTRMITKINAPTHFCLNNVIFGFGTNFTISSRRVYMKNLVDLLPSSAQGRSLLTIKEGLELLPGTQVNIRTATSLSIKELYSKNHLSSLILNSAQLIYTATTTPLFIFRNPSANTAGDGRIIVKGQSELKTSSSLLKLILPATNSLILDSGAQLKLSTPAALSIA